jgi:segregation and condensation protein A
MPDPDAGTATATTIAPTEGLQLQLEGFEGPLDLLLDLARKQKVDLARISILQLVEQYLSIVEGARKVRLELAADWLVMAAWLAWLKSRLLVPADPEEAEEGEQAAEVLAARLRDLETIRAAALWLGERPILGQTVFARGLPENFTETDRSRIVLDLPALMRAYLSALRRGGARHSYQPKAFRFWTVNDALARLQAMLGELPSWTSLERFLPEQMDLMQRRAALASTLIAGLEMAKGGLIQLQQDETFGPILISPATPQEDAP